MRVKNISVKKCVLKILALKIFVLKIDLVIKLLVSPKNCSEQFRPTKCWPRRPVTD